MKYLLAMFLCFMVYLTIEASEPKLCYVPVPSSDMEADSSWVNESATKQDTLTKKKSLLTRFLDYFNDANKNKEHKKFDFSIIGGPHYSTDTKLGIGLVAAGLYRANANDTLLPPSNVSLFGDVSTVGFYMLGIRGTHIFHKTSIVPTTPSISIPSPASSGAWDMTWAMTTATRAT